MVDTSRVDILALIERKAGIRTVGKPGRVRGVQEIHSNCPWCPGTEDSFIIRPEEGTYSHAIRQGTGSGCGRHGDVINFLYEWEGSGFLDACEELGIPLDGNSSSESVTYRRYKPEFTPQTKRWRDTAETKLDRAQALIHQGIGLEYARRRGLTDGTILDWRLGYVPFRNDTHRFFTLDADEWGIDHDEKYFMYEGLLIPWFVKGKVWKLQVRRISGKFDKKNKILPIKGSIPHCLFNQDAISTDKPVVLVESALCAISGNQEAGALAIFIATGGAKANQYEHNVALLACAPVVLAAFDDDENESGDKGAKYWLDSLPHAFRWLPWSKDINAMLVEGKDIKAWVEVGLLSAALEEADQSAPLSQIPASVMGSEQTSVPNQDGQEDLDQLAPLPAPDAPDCLPDLPDACVVCGGAVECYRSDGTPYCAKHFPQRAGSPPTQDSNPLDDPVVQEVIKLFDARLIEVMLKADWPRRKAELFAEERERILQDRRERMLGKWISDPSRPIPESVWSSLPRAPIWQRLVDQSIAQGNAFTGLDWMRGDYWTDNRLLATGYSQAFAASDERILSLILPARVYPCPVPRYELQEDEPGVLRLVTIGYWSEEVDA